MKKTIIALMALAGMASADTINPLDNAGDWTSASNNPSYHEAHPLPTIAGGSYRWATNWGQGYSSYSFGEAITLTAGSTDTLSLEYTITIGANHDGVMTLALLGSSGTSTIVSGMSYKSPILYALTDTTANSYTFGDYAKWGTVLSGTALNSETTGKTSYDLAYDIQWNDDADNFELTISLNGNATEAINLGSNDISFSGIVITTDGGPQWGESYATLSNLSVTAVPEPTTATLSLLALAGLAARRRRK